MYGLLIVLILILGYLLFREIKDVGKLTTRAVEEPLIAERAVSIPISPSDQILGSPGAPLTVVEYIDLKNDLDQRLHREISAFVNSHPQNIRLVFKHSPIPKFFLGDGVLAHQAVFCAGKQKKGTKNMMWPFLHELVTNDNNLREKGLRKTAQAAGLDINNLWNCVESEEARQAVLSNRLEAEQLRVGEPPLIFLNNRKLNIQQDFDLTELLSSLIKN